MIERRAYSLLELLIALGLVGALLTVAWSLLSTYQKAELTAWNLVERTQAIRLVRDTLERDLLQVVLPVTQSPVTQSLVTLDQAENERPLETSYSDTGFEGSNPTTSTAPSTGARFFGNSFGFTTLIKPSVDPMPVFQQLFNGDYGDPAAEESDGNFVGQDETNGLTMGHPALMNTEPVTVEYRIRPEPGWENLPTPPPATTGAERPGSESWLLVRSELQEYSELTDVSADEIESTQRELNASDLYRNVDIEQNKLIEKQRETVVARLGRGRFSYFDGRSWRSNWSVEASGQFPKAVALTFDLVKGSGPPARLPTASPEVDSESTFDSIQKASEFMETDWNTASEGMVEPSEDSAQVSDLRIVVRLWQVPAGQNRVDE